MEADRLLTDAVDRGPAGADGVDLALLASIRALQRTGQMSPSRDEASAGIAERPLDRVGLDQRLAAEIASLTGEPTQARDLALAAVESRRPMPPLTRVALMAIGAGGAIEAGIQARATRNPGEAEASFKVARRLQAVAGEVARPLTSGPAASTMRDEIEAWTLEARAHVARVGPSAADAWAEVSGRWLELGRPPRALGASVIEVEALAGGRDRARAQAVLERAYDLARELGAEAVRRQLETLARGMRLRVPGSEPGTRTPESQRPFGLTEREREVLALVAAGRTNREIGDALAMSASTASVHVSRILSKLGVQGRVEAAAAAIRAGLDRLD
jgi:DNA-binding CsgD family transcriptional regulator